MLQQGNVTCGVQRNNLLCQQFWKQQLPAWRAELFGTFACRFGKHITWKQPASDALTSARIPRIHNANIFYPICGAHTFKPYIFFSFHVGYGTMLNLWFPATSSLGFHMHGRMISFRVRKFQLCLQRQVHELAPHGKIATADSRLEFNFWTNWSLQGNTACSRQFWWKRLRTNYTTQCQHKDVSKDFRTRNYRLPSTKPPEMENYPGVANPDWSSAQGKTVTRCIIWRLFKKYYDSRKWARDEASPGPSIHSRKGRDGDTQTHQIIILGVS